MRVNDLQRWVFGLGLFFSLNLALGAKCSKNLSRLVPHQERTFSDIYTELQKLSPQGATKLALQDDFDERIDPAGGGACASTTAFNILQGLRLKSGKTALTPEPVLSEAFESIPELLAGRVTNEQMTKLLAHLGRYLPDQALEVSFERAPQSKAVGDEAVGRVWKQFKEKQLEMQPNEIKMVVFQVHNKDGELLGRHFVVLKRKMEGKNAVVIDPSKPSKELFYEFIDEPSQEGKSAATVLVRPDRVPHGRGWKMTLDTIFSVKINPTGR